jgi:hypothetical protein
LQNPAGFNCDDFSSNSVPSESNNETEETTKHGREPWSLLSLWHGVYVNVGMVGFLTALLQQWEDAEKFSCRK